MLIYRSAYCGLHLKCPCDSDSYLPPNGYLKLEVRAITQSGVRFKELELNEYDFTCCLDDLEGGGIGFTKYYSPENASMVTFMARVRSTNSSKNKYKITAKLMAHNNTVIGSLSFQAIIYGTVTDYPIAGTLMSHRPIIADSINAP